MLIKLTGKTGVLLVDTTGIAFLEDSENVLVYQQSTDEAPYFSVKETIEEIEQQIKEGGICGSTN